MGSASMKRLVLLGSAALLAGVMIAGSASAQTPPPFTTSVVTVTPGTTAPGTTASLVGNFEVIGIAPSGVTTVGIEILGTDGFGTLTAGASDPGLSCTGRAYFCDLPVTAMVGDKFEVSATIQVSDQTTARLPEGTNPEWEVAAYAVGPGSESNDSFDDDILTITIPPVPTTVPPTTVAPTTAPVTTVPGTDAPATTAPPTNELPETGVNNSWLALIAGIVLAMGVVVVGVTRRGTAA
jgi:LPXTG-motif cell wall-anchored protein